MTTGTLLTQSINFGSVPVGETAIKPIDIAISGPASFTAQATSGFGYLPKSLLGGGGPQEQVWVKYTAPNAPGPQQNGSIAIGIAGGGGLGEVQLSATPVARQPRSVCLVLDRSGSMGQQAGFGNTRMFTLQLAAPVLVKLLLDTDNIGLVAFSTNASPPLYGMSPVGPLPRATVLGHIGGLIPNGLTSIGSGLQVSAALLSNAPRQATVVFTDGEQNTAPLIATVAGQITGSVYAIGLGTAAALNPGPLKELCDHHDGYLIVTGSADVESDDFELEKYFLQILAGVTNEHIIVDPSTRLRPGETSETAFRVTELDNTVTVIVLSTNLKFVVIKLLDPDGAEVTWGAQLTGFEWGISERLAFIRFSLPAADLGDAHRGKWAVQVERPRDPERDDGLPIDVSVHTNSALGMTLRATQASTRPGAEVRVNALLTLASVAWSFGGATVRMTLQWPDGIVSYHDLVESRRGVFDVAFTAAIPGTYTLQVTADGVFDDLVTPGSGDPGVPFSRFAKRTISVWVPPTGGPRPVPGEDSPDEKDRKQDKTRGPLGPVWRRIRHLFHR